MPGTATISWISSNFDADAQAFITNFNITNTTEKSALNTLVIAAKANGWWSLCNAIYPMVGSANSTCKGNLKDPRDLDAAFRLSFVNTPTFAATGVTFNGSTQYADTFLLPSTTLSLNSSHISLWSRTSAASTGISGNYDTANSTVFVIYRRYTDNTFYAGVNQNPEESAIANTDGSGFYMASRTGANIVKYYKNATEYSKTTASTLLSGVKTLIGAGYNGATIGQYDNFECSFFTLGSGISSAIAALMYTNIQSFQTALGR